MPRSSPTVRASSACTASTFSAKVIGRPSRSRVIAMRSGNDAYTAATSDSGVVGPIWSGMLQCSCSQRELDLECCAVGGITVLGNEGGDSGRVVGDAPAEQQGIAGRARE